MYLDLEGEGVLPEKLFGGVQPASQNPYPIYDQNQRYFLPYLWPDQKFQTLLEDYPRYYLLWGSLTVLNIIQTDMHIHST